MSGKWGKADGRWGTGRLILLGTKWGSCKLFANRILACLLTFMGLSFVGAWACSKSKGTGSSRGLPNNEEPRVRPRIDHWLHGPVFLILGGTLGKELPTVIGVVAREHTSGALPYTDSKKARADKIWLSAVSTAFSEDSRETLSTGCKIPSPRDR